MITGYAPGGTTDIAARILADRMASHLGPDARIVVENRPGAAGAVATEWLKRQPPDGYTVMVTETGAAAAAPAALIGGTRYDPVADFTHLGVISTPPGLLVVTERFPAATPAAVLAHLRSAPPDSVTYASSGFGGVLHLRAEMLAQALGTRFVHVPYRSGAQMVQAIMTGEAQFGIAAVASATPLVRDGKVRGRRHGGRAPLPALPGHPDPGGARRPGLRRWRLLPADRAGRPAAAGGGGAEPRPGRCPSPRPTSARSCSSPATTRCRGRTPRTTRAPSWCAQLASYAEIVQRTGIRLQP